MLRSPTLVMVDTDFFFMPEISNFFVKLSRYFKCTVLDYFGNLNTRLLICPTHLSCVLPETNNYSLEELCYLRCKELLSLELLDKYYFCWSGGVDSTLMVVSALKFMPPEKICIIYTEDSVREYPALFYKYIANIAHILVYPNNLPNYPVSSPLILGQYVPDHSINIDYWLYRKYGVNTKIHDFFIRENNLFHEYLDDYTSHAYFPISTVLDLFLFIQLTCKANTESYLYNNSISFFSTPYFYDYFIRHRYCLFPYKYEMKKEIIQFTKDYRYMYKPKITSILKTTSVDAIDTDGNCYNCSKYSHLSFLQKLQLLCHVNSSDSYVNRKNEIRENQRRRHYNF